MNYIEIENITEFEGGIPANHDLVIMERGIPESALVLCGVGEVCLFDDDFKDPIYAFMKR